MVTTGPLALVTGASRGIGLELAGILAANGHDLALAARDAERLQSATRLLAERHGVSVTAWPVDLAAPAAAEALWENVAATGKRVDVLVNNAGVGLHGPFAEEEAGRLDAMLALNVAALTALTRLALPDMIARRAGRIMNVASVAGFQPGGPGMAAYYATKAYVLSFSRGLARELGGSGVTVTALAPGPTATGFDSAAGASGTGLYRWLPPQNATAVAQAGYRGMMRGAAVVVPGLLNKLMAFAGELPPRRITLEANRLLLQGERASDR